MNVAKQTNSPSTKNNKKKCHLVPLVGLLLSNGKEIYQAAEIILYYAPKV
jgi:hypothetical protein